MDLVSSFFNGRGNIKHINATFVTLMPKVAGASWLNQFHPILCVNAIYKIMSKLLDNKLSKVMLELLSPNQFAFTKGRLISYNILLTEEHFRDLIILVHLGEFV